MLGLVLAALLVHEGDAHVEFNAKSTEVVIAPDAPATVRFAASEMTNFLSRAFGASVPVVQGFANGRTAIVLGDNEWTRQAGIDVRKLPRDGFSLRIGKSRVFIAGRDDPKRDLFRDARSGNVWATLYEHATLFGVYEFLERYAGCRFYFPGRIGEVVPRRASVRVDGGGFDMSPDFIVRRYLAESDGFWFNDDGSDGPKNHPDKSLNWLRLRMQTFNIPCSHGQRAHEITKRFADTHPEYFWLRPDGTRCTNRTSRATGEWDIHQLCQSSAVRDEIYKDVVSYLKGEPPSVRRIPNRWKRRPDQPDYAWPISMNGNYVDIMPQDGYRRCCCEKCRVRYVDDENFASEFLWDETARFANRLTADGFTNAVVTMMAYRPYRRIPDVDIPANVRVMVAETGPWTLNNPSIHRRDCDEVRAWARKVKFGKVWLWYYPHKSGLVGIPQFSPRAQGEYIKSLAPSLFGYFAESESDRFLFNFLNYYTVAKVAWDNRTDVGALLDEHYEKMYGPAAPEMKAFFETLERKWVYEIQGRIVENEMGPICFPPSEYDLFTKVFSPDVLKDLESFLDVAARKAGRNTVEAERVWFMRNAFFKSLKFKSEVVLAATDVAAERKRRAAVRPKNLYPFPGETYELATTNTQVIHRDLQAGSLKPETRYRVSFFAKLDNVVPKKRWGSGIYLWADDAGGEHADSGDPEYLSGTTPWIHTSFVFTTGKTPGRSRRPFVRFCAAAVAGRCTIKDVLVEELGPLAPQKAVATEVSGRRLVILDVAPGAPTKYLWECRPEDDPNVKAQDRGTFAYLDECKVKDDGRTILFTSSADAFGAVDVATKRLKWYGRVPTNLHSIELLPDGKIVLAASKGADKLVIVDVSKHPFDPSRQDVKDAAPLLHAHGVVWDSKRNCLWALGTAEIVCYDYAADKVELHERGRWKLPCEGGHDLVPAGDDFLLVTTAGGVWQFDRTAHRLSSYCSEVDDIKSVSHSETSGDLYSLATIRYWSDRATVRMPAGGFRQTDRIANNLFYKMRWLEP